MIVSFVKGEDSAQEEQSKSLEERKASLEKDIKYWEKEYSKDKKVRNLSAAKMILKGIGGALCFALPVAGITTSIYFGVTCGNTAKETLDAFQESAYYRNYKQEAEDHIAKLEEEAKALKDQVKNNEVPESWHTEKTNELENFKKYYTTEAFITDSLDKNVHTHYYKMYHTNKSNSEGALLGGFFGSIVAGFFTVIGGLYSFDSAMDDRREYMYRIEYMNTDINRKKKCEEDLEKLNEEDEM